MKLVYVIFTCRYFKFSHLLLIISFLIAQMSYLQVDSFNQKDIMPFRHDALGWIKIQPFFLLADEQRY